MNGWQTMYKDKFPLFKKNDFVFLDSAASTQKPQKVLDSLVSFYQNQYANVHRGSCHLASQATFLYEEARQKIARFIHAPSEQVIFTKGATESINLVASGYRTLLKQDDEILVSIAEHHANFVSWQQVAKETGAKFITFDILENGEINLEDFEEKLSSRTKIVAFTHLSNVLGVVYPVKKMVYMAHKVGAKVLLDGAQSVAHLPVDMIDLDIDYFVFSGHKLYAPTGIGVLYGKSEALEILPPYQFGGDMVEKVSVQETTFKSIPYKFEAGTPPFAEAIALGTAIDFLSDITMQKIEQDEKELTQYLLKGLLDIDDVEIVAPNQNKQGIISFVVKGVHPSDIAFTLSEQKICIRLGHHCAIPIHNRLGYEATLRVSLGLYNDKNDIDIFLNALKKSISLFKGLN